MTGLCAIYGASGFTGEKIARLVRRKGVALLLIGRSREKLTRLSKELRGLPGHQVLDVRVAALDEPAALDSALAGVSVMLNAAGPYSQTALPVAKACLRTKTHYLDVTGELPALQQLAALDATARQRAVMLMPAVGYAIVPTDCLALRASRLLSEPTHLRIALSEFDVFGPGSAKTMLGLIDSQVAVRRGGQMIRVPVGRLERRFDFGAGERLATAINWIDTFTAHATTGIPNIEVYLEADTLARSMYALSSANHYFIRQPLVQSLLTTQAEWFLSLGSRRNLDARLHDRKRSLVVEVANARGSRVQLRLTTPDPYRVTQECAFAVISRVLQGQVEAGYRTPAAVYGDGLLDELSDCQLEMRTR